MYWNCLLTRLWRHKFWNWAYLYNQAVFQLDKNSGKIFKWERKELRWNKKHFLSFLRGFSCQTFFHESAPLVVVIPLCRVQYSKYFPSFSYFSTLLAIMKTEEIICQCCAIGTLLQNVYWNQISQELSYLLTYCF